jgi:hypothetical protein
VLKKSTERIIVSSGFGRLPRLDKRFDFPIGSEPCLYAGNASAGPTHAG